MATEFDRELDGGEQDKRHIRSSPSGDADDTDGRSLRLSDTIADSGNAWSGSDSDQRSRWYWIASVGVQAADAISYAHENGVLHRDIKPSNLILDSDGNLFVTDFGLAKLADDQSLTASGDLLGTLRYMPPESLHGETTDRGDVYGLGLTTGRPQQRTGALQSLSEAIRLTGDQPHLRREIAEKKGRPWDLYVRDLATRALILPDMELVARWKHPHAEGVDSGQRLSQYGGVADSGRHTSMAVLSGNASAAVAENF